MLFGTFNQILFTLQPAHPRPHPRNHSSSQLRSCLNNLVRVLKEEENRATIAAQIELDVGYGRRQLKYLCLGVHWRFYL